MQRLYLAPTKTTFEVDFDPKSGTFGFKGKSYPSNALEFFHPLIEWINRYLLEKSQATLEINFKVVYFNTSSSKYLFEILDLFNRYHNNSGKVLIRWYAEEGNEDIFETWKELVSELDLPFEIIES